MKLDTNQQVFLELLRAGLWETEVRLLPFGEIDYAAVFKLAEDQSVVGLIAAGLEHVADVKPQKKDVIQFIGGTMKMELRNTAMNSFIATVTDRMQEAGIHSVLVKGQGVAQCYERPLWRACGDVDLLLDHDNYELAKSLLIPQATKVEKEFSYLKHIGLHFGEWEVELHGHFRSRLSKRVDDELDALCYRCLGEREVRVWHNNDTNVYLPAPDVDVLFSFTHFLRHFYFEGVGLRQICDWIRLLYRFHDVLNLQVLEQRIKRMQLMSEWKAFGTFAVEWLGMQAETMPLYVEGIRWSHKAERIVQFVLKVGNFGHNKNNRLSVRVPWIKESYILRKVVSAWEHLGFVLRHFPIFPKDSILFFWQVMRSGIEMAVTTRK